MDNNNGLSASDLALISGNNGMNGEASWIWVLLLMFCFFGGNGFGGFGNNVAATQGGYVTNSQMNDSFNFAALERQNNETVAAVNQSKYDAINSLKDTQAILQSQLSNIAGMEQNIIEKQQTCCAGLSKDISEATASIAAGIANIGYQAAMNTASINENTTAQTQKILDAISGNRIADMQNQINTLQLQNAMAGVMKYPMTASYYAGYFPFPPYPAPAPTGI